MPSLETIDPASVARSLAVDKKVREGKLHFVLPRRIGEVEIVAGIAPREVIGVLKELAKANPFLPSKQRTALPARRIQP